MSNSEASQAILNSHFNVGTVVEYMADSDCTGPLDMEMSGTGGSPQMPRQTCVRNNQLASWRRAAVAASPSSSSPPSVTPLAR